MYTKLWILTWMSKCSFTVCMTNITTHCTMPNFCWCNTKHTCLMTVSKYAVSAAKLILKSEWTQNTARKQNTNKELNENNKNTCKQMFLSKALWILVFLSIDKDFKTLACFCVFPFVNLPRCRLANTKSFWTMVKVLFSEHYFCSERVVLMLAQETEKAL